MKKIGIKLLIIFLIFISSALAHKVNIFAYRERGQIIGESYFADGSPCKNCKIEVYSEKGTKLAETKTDENGKFLLPFKEKGKLKVIVEAGEGHRGEYELEALSSEKSSVVPSLGEKFFDKKEDKKVKEEELSALKQFIEETVENHFQKLKAELVLEVKKELNKTYLRDIIGGIGYIFGVWGIIALIKNKKNK